jgi:uncharacterized membrane protein YgdD (TMEM256/DUF423 family)
MQMLPLSRLFLVCGALGAMLAVILGAFGAHALQARLTPQLMATYHTAAQYQFYHSLGLLVIALLALRAPAIPGLRWAGVLMIVGIVLFSGSLYALCFTGVRGLGAITPLGGVAFIAAWATLALGALRSA